MVRVSGTGRSFGEQTDTGPPANRSVISRAGGYATSTVAPLAVDPGRREVAPQRTGPVDVPARIDPDRDLELGRLPRPALRADLRADVAVGQEAVRTGAA
jgi:hypothetical protein